MKLIQLPSLATIGEQKPCPSKGIFYIICAIH
jgi:hypothetical protein